MDTMTIKQKLLDAEARSARWLADGNQADEREPRNERKAWYCWSKAQYWLDRANRLKDKLDGIE